MILQSGKIDRRISFFLHYIVFFHGHKYLEKRLKHCQQHYHVFSVVRKSEKEKKEMVQSSHKNNKQANKHKTKQNCNCYLFCFNLFGLPTKYLGGFKKS